jgi:hypothetical protein
VTLFRRFLRLYLPIASAIVAVGCFAAFATTVRLVWGWRDSWSRDATLGSVVAVALFLAGALFLRLAIYQPWRGRLERGNER